MVFGCRDTGPRSCRISGEVTIDGVPVQEDAISFDIVDPGDLLWECSWGIDLVGGFFGTIKFYGDEQRVLARWLGDRPNQGDEVRRSSSFLRNDLEGRKQ